MASAQYRRDDGNGGTPLGALHVPWSSSIGKEAFVDDVVEGGNVDIFSVKAGAAVTLDAPRVGTVGAPEPTRMASNVTTTTTKLTKKKTNVVQFGQVTIYHCAVALGDSPSCSSGPPICLGAVVGQKVTTVNRIALVNLSTDRWCSGTEQNTPPRRTMKLTPNERIIMLLTAGVDHNAIEMAAIQAREARVQLMQAIQRRRARKERSDNFRRFFTRLFSRQDEALLAAVAAITPTTTAASTTTAANPKIKRPIVRAAMAC
jgi:hypothetical protein